MNESLLKIAAAVDQDGQLINAHGALLHTHEMVLRLLLGVIGALIAAVIILFYLVLKRPTYRFITGAPVGIGGTPVQKFSQKQFPPHG